MEVDYDTWRNNIEFYLNDVTFSDVQIVRKIVECLLPPAANIIKNLGPQTDPRTYLSLLDSAYASVEDGDKLFAKFLNTNQNAGEKASAYLQRLQSALSNVIRRGGMAVADMDHQLLKQFCRGCWNNSLISSLQLEHRKSNPLPFSEFLLLIRTEEDKEAAKSLRMKQHLGLPKAKVQSHLQSVECCTDEIDTFQNVSSSSPITKRMQKQIAELQMQLATLRATKNEQRAKLKMMEKSAQPCEGKANKKLRPWYCFCCGEDGHIAPSCCGDPNPELVEAKKKELKEKL
ncbi:paraneoplastic antigen Ma1-like [Chanodichthys erythropterus]|uniref:paraneoplastic antigen Ma1-like n=1 Tax=Chanodichthys erythropterus TaxID=933992 RepID=UPI00351F0E87